MNIDPEDWSDEDEAAKIFKPINDLLAREAEDLKKLDETIREAEKKSKDVIREPEP